MPATAIAAQALSEWDMPPQATITPLGDGLINRTWLVTTPRSTSPRYVLQQVNTDVFPDPDQLMLTIERVTQHLRAAIIREGGNPDTQTLRIVRARDGSLGFHTDEGYFRVWNYIDWGTCYQTGSPDICRRAGAGFGRFTRRLADFPADTLKATLPGFHDTPARLTALIDLARRDPADRVKSSQHALATIFAHQQTCSTITDLLASGILPVRVCHMDTKLSNIIIGGTVDHDCVIDLDTTMAGSALWDLADCIRSAAGLTAEDERDLGKAGLSMPRCQAVLEGYLAEAQLTDAELEWVEPSIETIILEQAIRFLTDYLNGDTYYATTREDQNLDRALVQLAILDDVISHRADIEAMIAPFRQ